MTGKTHRYDSTWATRNLASFEFYMPFYDYNIQEEIDRNGLAYFWTFGVTKEALGDGFDLMLKGRKNSIKYLIMTLFKNISQQLAS